MHVAINTRFKLTIPVAGILCKGRLVNACGLGGLCKAHSNPGECLPLSILNKSLNNSTFAQGYPKTALPSTSCRYTICKNNSEAITETIEPTLLTIFQPVKASG